MDPALRTAATGMIAQQTRTEVIANNLANVNTTGFKRSRAEFEDLLYQTVQGATTAGTPDGKGTPAVQVGRGTRLVAVSRLHSQGTIEETQRPLDLAIEGEGFFQVQLQNGTTAYTRDGSFQISGDGTLVTSSGDTVAPGIKVPADAGMGHLLQGSLEASNVEIVQEMVDMITSMRAYEINSKAIKNSEEMMDIANQMIR